VSTGSGMAVARAGMTRMACARMENFILIELKKTVELIQSVLASWVQSRRTEVNSWRHYFHFIVTHNQPGYILVYGS
jgi:hypothetical protein